MFYIGLYRENVKIFLSEPTRPRALIFGMEYHLVDLYQVSSTYTPWANKSPCPGGQMFYIGFYRESVKKTSCLKPHGLEP